MKMSIFEKIIFLLCVIVLMYCGFIKSFLTCLRYYYQNLDMIRVCSRSDESDETICVICQDDLPRTGAARVAYCHCVLRYHVECLKSWMNQNASCPSCRQKPPRAESIRFMHELMVQYESMLFGNTYARCMIVGSSLYMLVHFVSRSF